MPAIAEKQTKSKKARLALEKINSSNTSETPTVTVPLTSEGVKKVRQRAGNFVQALKEVKYYRYGDGRDIPLIKLMRIKRLLDQTCAELNLRMQIGKEPCLKIAKGLDNHLVRIVECAKLFVMSRNAFRLEGKDVYYASIFHEIATGRSSTPVLQSTRDKIRIARKERKREEKKARAAAAEAASEMIDTGLADII